jgi:hypothetical protein
MKHKKTTSRTLKNVINNNLAAFPFVSIPKIVPLFARSQPSFMLLLFKTRHLLHFLVSRNDLFRKMSL